MVWVLCIILSVYLVLICLAGMVCEFFEGKEIESMTNTLFEINRQARFADCECAGYALEWFVNSGRSTWRFDLALKKANPEKLVRYIGNDGDYREAIIKAKRYLKRYCGYSEEG